MRVFLDIGIYGLITTPTAELLTLHGLRPAVLSVLPAAQPLTVITQARRPP